MRRAIWLTTAAAATLTLGACLSNDGPVGPSCSVVSIPAVSGDTVRSESGLKYLTIGLGTGAAAQATSTVAVHYEGYLPDGTLFDRTQGQPAVFPLQQVIPGFREGVVGMRADGGARRLIVPPDLALRCATARGACIPPNSTLIFDG
jgi:FKBP-type peptidyl-prolyl cis-trans isomerase